MTRRFRSASATRSGVGNDDKTPISRFSDPPVNGLAPGVIPLPLRISSCLPSREYDTPVGYKAVGMNPSTKLRPALLTSTTATAFKSETATSSCLLSGESASALGVDVRGALG